MMEPRIQYAQTEDGVSIAYWTLGEGPPLFVTSNAPLSPSLRSWQDPPTRAYWKKLARNRLLIRYDHRGCGNSQHDISKQSFDTLVADLEAVADQAGLEEFALFGNYWCAPYAIAYAVRHPERITKMILLDASARGFDFFNHDRLRKARELEDDDPEFYLQILAHEALGWAGSELAQSLISDTLKEVDPRVLRMTTDTVVEADVTNLLPQIAAPTLVLHRRDQRYPGLDAARTLAAGIPGAQLLVLEGNRIGSYIGNPDAVVGVIDDFLADAGQAQNPSPAPSTPGGITAILFLDIVDSTALTTKLGDAAYREKERELDASLRAAITEAGGTPVEGKVLGDGIMAVFTSARQAIEAAVRCRDLGNEAGLPLHLGIHAGDVVREGNNVHGGAVQLAARVQGAAAPGEILVSATVRDLARTSAGVAFEDRGEHELKGIAEPQRLFAVRE